MSSRSGTTKGGDVFGLVGTLLEGKYRVDRLVAEGGFGVVYAGEHLGLKVPIALKVLKTPAELGDSARRAYLAQFTREAQTIARVRHPNIVQVLDVGASETPKMGSSAWMVLEWLTGHTLQQELRARRGQGGSRPEAIFGLLKPLIEAVALAHDEGIAHRDIKPANIMLVSGKRGVTAKVLDFGIAKLMESGESAGSGQTMTRGNSNSFSPLYAAPEQVAGTRTGPWTDVHALGLILSEMLCDRPPYMATDMAVLFSQVLSTERPTPKKHGVEVGALEPILQRALAFKPEDRFQNAGALLTALSEVIHGTAPWAISFVEDTSSQRTSIPSDSQRLNAGLSGNAPISNAINESTRDGVGETRDVPIVPFGTDSDAGLPRGGVFAASTTLSSSAHARDLHSLPAIKRGGPPKIAFVGAAVLALGVTGALVIPRLGRGSNPAPAAATATPPTPAAPPSTPTQLPSQPAGPTTNVASPTPQQVPAAQPLPSTPTTPPTPAIAAQGNEQPAQPATATTNTLAAQTATPSARTGTGTRPRSTPRTGEPRHAQPQGTGSSSNPFSGGFVPR